MPNFPRGDIALVTCSLFIGRLQEVANRKLIDDRCKCCLRPEFYSYTSTEHCELLMLMIAMHARAFQPFDLLTCKAMLVVCYVTRRTFFRPRCYDNDLLGWEASFEGQDPSPVAPTQLMALWPSEICIVVQA